MGAGCSSDANDQSSKPQEQPAAASKYHPNVATPTLIETEAMRLEQPGTQQQRRLNPQQLEKLKFASLKLSVFAECLTTEQLQFLASTAEMKKWSIIGDRICEQGMKADTMYVVHKGEVLLEVQDAALDNRANQLQVARILAEQELVPLTAGEAQGHKVPSLKVVAPNQRSPVHGAMNTTPSPQTSPKRSPKAVLPQPTEQHPASVGHANQKHGAVPGGRHNPSGVPLTRAELIAIEAAARVEQESASDGPISKSPGKSPARSPDLTNATPSFSPLGVGMDSSFLAPPSLDNQEEFETYTAALPETYTEEQRMFMCVKTPTQCFGVGMFFAAGQRYMYSVLNNSLSTHLICLGRKGFEALWSKWPDVRAPLMKHLGEFLEDSLAKSNWLNDASIVPRAKLTLLTSFFHHATVPQHTMLFEEGDICSDDSPLYFILSGSVELTFTNEKGHKLTKILSKGSVFGELGVLLGFSITASAMTLENCVFRLCKRRWLNLFSMMTPRLVPALRANLHKNYHVRDEQLLENSEVQNLFSEFCLKEFNAENIEFWSVAIRFRKVTYPNHAHNEEDVLAEAAMIYNRYISETSVLQINIKQSIRSVIKASLQAGEVHKDLFLAAEREICQLMLQDTFSRFKQTPLYTMALSMLHAPPALPILLNHTNTASMAPAIRAREYSRTDDTKNGHTAGAGGAAPRGKTGKDGGKASPNPNGAQQGHVKKATVTLDDAVDDSSRPLMFGGKSRAAAAAPVKANGGTSPKADDTTPTVEVETEPQAVLAPGDTSGGSALHNGDSGLGPSALDHDPSDRAVHHHLVAPSSHSLHLSADGSDQFRLHNDVDGKDVALEERQKAFAKEVAAGKKLATVNETKQAAAVTPTATTQTGSASPSLNPLEALHKQQEEEKISSPTASPAPTPKKSPSSSDSAALAVPKPKPRSSTTAAAPQQQEKGTPANLPKQKLQPKRSANTSPNVSVEA